MIRNSQFVSVIIRAFGAVLALSCLRFLLISFDRKIAPEWILLLLFCLILVAIAYKRRLRTRRKRNVILFFLYFFLVFLFVSLLRLFIMDSLFSFLGLATSFICYVSSAENESGNSAAESGGLPRLESESSSESLNTFRNVIAAENEAEIYQRIRFLENQDYYNLPPQNNPGDYEQLVRENFNSAINVNHFRTIYDMEYFDLQVLEKKGLLQDKLLNLLLEEQNLSQILERSPYSNIRKEAYHFLEDKLRPVGDPRHAFQRNILDGSLNFFIYDLNLRGRRSSLYQDFQSYFVDN